MRIISKQVSFTLHAIIHEKREILTVHHVIEFSDAKLSYEIVPKTVIHL